MIVPGSANPLLMAQAGDPLDELGKIERSVRFRDSASASFSRVFPAAGNRAKWAMRALVRRSKLSAIQFLLGVDQGAGNYDRVAYQATDAIEYNNGGTGAQAVVTPGRYRDPSAWADVLVHYDSGNATQADRAIVFIDGDRVSGAGSFALNQLSSINSAVNHSIGGIYPFGGYLAYFCFFDDKLPPASVFGQKHPRTGQWRPYAKARLRANVATLGGVRNGWGANGCFLPFDDTTSLTTLGYDRSQSDTDTAGNNWTAVNVSLTPGPTYDSMLDTPTNNFCTMNPIDPSKSGSILDGALKISGTPANALSTQAIRSRKAYAECVYSVIGTTRVGPTVRGKSNPSLSCGYMRDGTKLVNGSFSAYGATFSAGDVIGICADYEADTVEFFKNGVSQGAISFSFGGGDFVFQSNSDGSGTSDTVTWNFGQQQQGIGGYFSEALGYFSYPPPSGAKAICTKNLPIKPPVMKSADAFVARTNSGANIVADLSAASPWSDWIRIYKRRDAAEGWRWQFSDDAGNFLDSSSTAAKAAFPALTGSAYVGYALKVSAQNGVATGRLVHINGANSVVTDGLANSRKAVMLRNEAGGNWFFYHPDLTAGKLLYLNLTNGETTDATINTVTASGFTVGAALASGTYRWIALAEVEGFLNLGKHIPNNGAADGPFFNSGLRPAFLMAKRIDAAQNGFVFDASRSPSNAVQAELRLNTADAEATGSNDVDFVAAGYKVRSSGTAGINQGTTGYVVVGVAAFPFRYANAR